MLKGLVELSVDERALERESAILVTAILGQASRSVARQTRGLEKDLEHLTQANVKGNLYRAWASAVYPPGGKPAYMPAGQIYLNGFGRTIGAMTYWTQPGVNVGRRGRWLAIPNISAGSRGRGRNLRPEDWERDNGIKLHFVPGARGKPAMLVARTVLSGRNGKGVRRATAKRLSGHYEGAETRDTVIFFLIPFQRFANKFSIEPTIARRGKMLVEDFAARLERVVKQDFRAGR